MTLCDNGHFFCLEDKGPKKQPRALWSLDFKATCAPVYRDGCVYIARENEYLALDAVTGKTKWSTALPGQGTAAVFIGDRLLVGGQHIDNHLYAFDITTGKELSRYRTVSFSAPVNATPLISDDSIIFAAGRTIIALDAHNLKKAWSAPLGRRVGYHPPIFAGELICVSTDEGYGKTMIHAVRRNGAEAWKIQAPNLQSNVACVGTMIYYVDEDSVLYLIDSATGAPVHSVRLLKERSIMNAPNAHLASDGEILLVTYEYDLFALDVQANQWLWSFHSSGVLGQPVIADGCVYFANLFDSLFCLDLKTGKELFRVKTQVRSDFACGLGGGMLFMAGSMSEHRLMAFAE